MAFLGKYKHFLNAKSKMRVNNLFCNSYFFSYFFCCHANKKLNQIKVPARQISRQNKNRKVYFCNLF